MNEFTLGLWGKKGGLVGLHYAYEGTRKGSVGLRWVCEGRMQGYITSSLRF